MFLHVFSSPPSFELACICSHGGGKSIRMETAIHKLFFQLLLMSNLLKAYWLKRVTENNP